MKKVIRLTELDLTRIVKRILKEEAEEKVEVTYSTSHGDITYIGQLGRNPNEDLYYFKPEEGGFEFMSNSSMKPNWGLEKEFNRLVGKELTVDYEYGPSIKLGGQINHGKMFIKGLLNGEENVKIKKI